jgi:ferredoxin
MKITVDQEKCIGCNMCEDISEGAIGTKFGKEGKAGLNPEADLTDRVVVANIKLTAETCPMQAIVVEE